jgi:hypothetical protein
MLEYANMAAESMRNLRRRSPWSLKMARAATDDAAGRD